MRQVRTSIKRMRLLELYLVRSGTRLLPHPAGSGVRANTAQQIRHCFGITQCSEDAFNSCRAERGEEILKVHPQYNSLAHMRSDEGLNRAPFDEPVSNWMRRHLLQNPSQNLALHRLQTQLRRFDESQAAGLLG